MKEGYRFVDCHMYTMEPVDLFDKYLDPAFKSRITSSRRPVDGGSTGMRGRPLCFFDGTPTSNDGNTSQYNRTRGPLVSARANTNVMFAVERGYDAEAQVMGMQLEGIDIAVLFPTAGLSFLARDNVDPQLSNAICRAYNDWLHDFCQHSPGQLKMAAMRLAAWRHGVARKRRADRQSPAPNRERSQEASRRECDAPLPATAKLAGPAGPGRRRTTARRAHTRHEQHGLREQHGYAERGRCGP